MFSLTDDFFCPYEVKMTFLAEKQRSEITTIRSKMTCSEMNGNPNLYTHQPHEVLHSYAVISTPGAHSPCQRLFMCCFRFRSSLKKCSCLRPKAEDKSACGRQSSSSHVRKNLWYPGSLSVVIPETILEIYLGMMLDLLTFVANFSKG